MNNRNKTIEKSLVRQKWSFCKLGFEGEIKSFECGHCYLPFEFRGWMIGALYEILMLQFM